MRKEYDGVGILLVLLFFLLLGVFLAGRAEAQTSIADRFQLKTGPCTLRSGSGTPEGAVTGAVCDLFHRTDTGDVYAKTTGSGNTGWTIIYRVGGTDVLVTDGGTGVSTLTSNGVLYGQGTSNVAVTAQGPTNSVLTASAGAPSFSATPTVTSLTTTGDVVVGGNAGTSSFASETTGWRVTAAGAADFRYLFTNEMRAKIFTADEESVLAGSSLVSKSFSTISQAFTCPAAGATSTLWVNDAKTYGDVAVFVASDWVVIHTLSRTALGGFTISDCVGQVTSYADGTGGNAGQQSWTFTRGSGGNAGAMSSSTVVAVNQLVVDYGVSGNGVVEQSAADGASNVNAPYVQIKTFATSPVAANFSTRCRLGQLTGITSVNEYGLICGTFGTAGPYFRISDTNFEIKGIPIKLYQSTTETIRLDAAGPYIALGNPLPSAYGTGTGIWMGNDSSTYKFRVGIPSGNRMSWDGTDLTVVAATVSIGSTGISIAQPPGSLTASYGYKFATGFTGTNNNGVYSYESSSSRTLELENGTTAAKDVVSFLHAGNGTQGASLTLSGLNTGAVGTFLLTATDSGTISAPSGTTHTYSLGVGAAPTGDRLYVARADAAAWAMGINNGASGGYGVYLQAGSSGAEYVQLWQTYNAGSNLGQVDGAGIWTKNTSSTWAVYSDAQLKKNIADYPDALSKLRQVRIREFDYINGDFGQIPGHGVGVVAQEIQSIFPNTVKSVMRQRHPDVLHPEQGREPVLTFDPHELYMATVAAVIELDQEVQGLKAEIVALKKGGQQ